MTRIRESEPNNTVAQANQASIDDVVEGEVNPAGDRDHISFQVGAGTALILSVTATEASRLDPTLTLLGPTGVLVAYNDDYAGLNSRITYTAQTAGRYVAVVAGYGGSGARGYGYEFAIDVVRPGPGDPTTAFATGFEAPWAMAAAGDGSLFVVSRTSGIVRSVGAGGAMREVAAGLQTPLGAAIDGRGQLLVVEVGRRRIARIDPATGATTVFAEGLQSPVAITVGTDAAVWVTDAGTRQLHRFDSEGRRERSVPLGSLLVTSLAFSPSGTLFLAGWSGVYRLEGSSLVRVLSPRPVDGIAFDQDGYLYAVNGSDGVVTLHGPSFESVSPVASSNIQGPSNLAFLRDAQGRMTSRLVVSNSDGIRLAAPFRNGVIEVNPTGVRGVGHRVGMDFLRLTARDTLPRAVMGAPYALQLSLTEPMSEPTTWSLASGGLPTGVSLNGTTGAIEGTPEQAGTWSFRVRMQTASRFGEADLRLEVHRPVVGAERAASHLLGLAGALTTDEQRFIDLVGNRNGRFDLGDFLLFLADQRTGPAASAAATPTIRRIP